MGMRLIVFDLDAIALTTATGGSSASYTPTEPALDGRITIKTRAHKAEYIREYHCPGQCKQARLAHK